ncbi:MAG: TonB-dependent receptor plug domain-containing protein [Sphingobium sp.]
MFKLETSSAAALAAGLIAVPASAQEIRGQEIQQASPQLQSPAVAAAVGPATGGLEEIVVTARRISENLQDVPVAITIYSGETLQRQNALRLSDIARTTPGLNIREANSNPAASTIALRGQVQTDVLATLDPSVGTYVDGLYWARAYGFNSNLLDLQSVQVLKGPQGTLFGRNTTGGAILVQTNDPDFSGISGLVSGTYGRFDERSATGIVNLPIVNDRIAVRAAVQRYLRDGITTDVGPVLPGRKYNNRDSWSARGKVLIQATDNLSILGSAEYFKSDLNGPTRRLS